MKYVKREGVLACERENLRSAEKPEMAIFWENFREA